MPFLKGLFTERMGRSSIVQLARISTLPKNPLAEVFGYKVDDMSSGAKRHRKLRLCPFNNRVESCTKDKKADPLGVCSVYVEGTTDPTITCPIRFREGEKDRWLILEEAATFFFPMGTRWMPLGEVRLKNKSGISAGNIDMVLVALNDSEKIEAFGAMEIQSVYISGNVRNPFRAYMKKPSVGAMFDWQGQEKYPVPDYLSSTRKRLMPQLLSKGEILQAWKTKQAIVVDEGFYARVPDFKEVPLDSAEVLWLISALQYDEGSNRFRLVLKKRVYTRFKEMLTEFAKSEAGDAADFMETLEKKLKREQKKKAKKTKKVAFSLPAKISVLRPRKAAPRKS
jgi:hypothetical protein